MKPAPGTDMSGSGSSSISRLNAAEGPRNVGSELLIGPTSGAALADRQRRGLSEPGGSPPLDQETRDLFGHQGERARLRLIGAKTVLVERHQAGVQRRPEGCRPTPQR